MSRQRMRAQFVPAVLAALVFTACTDDGGSTATTSGPAPSTSATSSSAPDVTSSTAPGGTGGPDGELLTDGQPFPASRCEANKQAGTITYLSGFDFAAAASIVDVVVAQKMGYFDDLCLKVELKPSFSTDNYPLIAANDAQFASGGSFSEVASFAAENHAPLVATSIEGKTAIDTLIVKPGDISEPANLKGTTIGVKGKLPPSIAALLAGDGLVEGTDFDTVLLDGFDPTVHYAVPNIAGFPGYKSNEPGQLKAAGLAFTTFDPTDAGIPGSFGVLYTNTTFVNEHPTAAQDFERATMKGLADAIADPEAAAAIALEFINGNGNPNFLSPEGEQFRWETEAKLVTDTTPEGTPLGSIDPDMLRAEIDAYAKVGLFGDAPPSIDGLYDTALLEGVYGTGGKVIWPSG